MEKQYVYQSHIEKKKGVELMCESIAEIGSGSVVCFILVTNPIQEVDGIMLVQGDIITIKHNKKKAEIVEFQSDSE